MSLLCQIGDYVDAQDSTKKWYEAIVRDIKPNSVRVHYFGWGSKWDAELPRRSGSGSKVRSIIWFTFCYISPRAMIPTSFKCVLPSFFYTALPTGASLDKNYKVA